VDGAAAGTKRPPSRYGRDDPQLLELDKGCHADTVSAGFRASRKAGVGPRVISDVLIAEAVA